jgi:hypothetical protein
MEQAVAEDHGVFIRVLLVVLVLVLEEQTLSLVLMEQRILVAVLVGLQALLLVMAAPAS